MVMKRTSHNGERFCSMCRRRPKEEGGSGSCEVPKPVVVSYRLRESVLGEGHHCLSYVLGDAKVKRLKPSQEGGLF